MPETIPIVELKDFRDIPYVANPDGVYHLFDIYIPTGTATGTSPPPLLCFVHGGAWRSYVTLNMSRINITHMFHLREDKSKHELLARRLASVTSYPVAIPNYRLTTPKSRLQHPAHAEDLLAFLHFAVDWDGPVEMPRPYDRTKIYAIGHSCSAHMLTAIFLEGTSTHAPLPTLTPSSHLMSSMSGIIMSEGIYDIDMLLRSFPGYKEWFISDTFGDHASYAPWNTMDMVLREGVKHTKWLVIHSQGDTLVDTIQSEGVVSTLRSMGADAGFNTDLEGDHNDVLVEEVYPRIVGEFALGCEDGKR